ncbi:MAG: hypothetical protein LAT84_07985 [Balneolia bacterium]|nr:hypothetical protein [Balneolia bacterium]
MKKFQNKYRIESTRLRNWDYGWEALYYITICTKNRVCWFGDVINSEMHLSEIGQITENEWIKTFEIRPDMNLTMGEFVVMPNHIHAIIGIGKNRYNDRDGGNADGGGNADRRDAMHRVSTSVPESPRSADSHPDSVSESPPSADSTPSSVSKSPRTPDSTSPPSPENHKTKNQFGPQSKNQFGPQSKNLASIVRGFKSAVTMRARLIHPEFEWHVRFHDHIIRNDKALRNISRYIINNPRDWKGDTFNPDRRRPRKPKGK